MTVNLQRAEFVTSAVSPKHFIQDGLPQAAFAGRSNVGKSSVINRLLNRKNFARVGASPGKTVHVNYFNIDGTFYLVDLPGYGYAKVSKAERDRWGRLMEDYFARPDLLTLGVLIVDARHKPTTDDCTMAQWFKDTGRPVVVVANKLDKLKKKRNRTQFTAYPGDFGAGQHHPCYPLLRGKGHGAGRAAAGAAARDLWLGSGVTRRCNDSPYTL